MSPPPRTLATGVSSDVALANFAAASAPAFSHNASETSLDSNTRSRSSAAAPSASVSPPPRVSSSSSTSMVTVSSEPASSARGVSGGGIARKSRRNCSARWAGVKAGDGGDQGSGASTSSCSATELTADVSGGVSNCPSPLASFSGWVAAEVARTKPARSSAMAVLRSCAGFPHAAKTASTEPRAGAFGAGGVSVPSAVRNHPSGSVSIAVSPVGRARTRARKPVAPARCSSGTHCGEPCRTTNAKCASATFTTRSMPIGATPAPGLKIMSGTCASGRPDESRMSTTISCFIRSASNCNAALSP